MIGKGGLGPARRDGIAISQFQNLKSGHVQELYQNSIPTLMAKPALYACQCFRLISRDDLRTAGDVICAR
jgi:hypothetical protein